jgi:ferredoxin-NADP reductase/Na+-translocating ferredoxin:NAD+ oxidoreductase RnfD subunit
MHALETFLNRITMYKLVLYGLIAIAASGLLLSAFGLISVNPFGLAASLAILLVSAYAAERLFSRLYGASTSVDSVWITALILFLTIAPPESVTEGALIALAGALAIISKYILTRERKHIFNPAAIVLVILSLTGAGLASWWVGSPYLLPLVALIGFLIIRKIHRFDAVLAFVAAGIPMALVTSAGMPPLETLSSLLISGPFIFFASFMLTEPLTMPPSRATRIVYGALVGALYASGLHIGVLAATPHLSLVLGNLFSYAVSFKRRLLLKLHAIERLSDSVYEFVFRPNRPFAFASGQYLEWTLPHEKPDRGGNRRYFTIASSPTEQDVRIGVRIDQKASSFKQTLGGLKKGDTIVATSLAGDFTLPKDKKTKLLFIAGGVGITPFASMLRSLLHRGEERDIVLFYAAASKEDLAYRTLLDRAERELGIAVVCITGGRISPEHIAKHAPDLRERRCYISGPDAMVRTYRRVLTEMGVPKGKIKTDYFTGFGA